MNTENAHTQTEAPRLIPRAEYETVIQQQVASLKRKDAMLERLHHLAAQIEAQTGQPVPGYVEPRRGALLS